MSSKRNANPQPFPTASSYTPVSSDSGEPAGVGQTPQNTYSAYSSLPPPQAPVPASVPAPPLTPPNPKKRRLSPSSGPSSMLPPESATSSTFPEAESPTQAGASAATVASPPVVKKSRTNTPWTPAEEQRLKVMRDAGNSWSEIAKTFPARTEGSVKKHWYKDMHYAEFAEDESAALLAAIKEYEANKWKVIGQKLGKPAKACEQYAKEHFAGKV